MKQQQRKETLIYQWDHPSWRAIHGAVIEEGDTNLPVRSSNPDQSNQTLVIIGMTDVTNHSASHPVLFLTKHWVLIMPIC